MRPDHLNREGDGPPRVGRAQLPAAAIRGLDHDGEPLLGPVSGGRPNRYGLADEGRDRLDSKLLHREQTR